jgi:ribosomal protein S18 acetylase RimI-like enzyme
MVKVVIEKLDSLDSKDLIDLCDVTEATMIDTFGFTIGFKQWQPPLRHDMEAYFKGIMIVPERQLIVARLDNTIVGSLQLLFSPKNNTSFFAVTVDNHFVVPWARNFGIAKKLLEFSESYAREKGFKLIKLSVRSDLDAAINLYERAGYKRWGTLKKYQMLGNQFISGFFYCKDL